MVPRRLMRADTPFAIAALAGAFAQDPLFIRVFGDKDDGVRARQVRTFLAGVVGMNRWSGGLRWGIDAPCPEGTVSADILAAAAIVECPRVGWTRARSGIAMMRLLPVAIALSRTSVQLVNRYGAAVRHAAPRTPHHYLTMIGVREPHRSQGMASALLAAIVEAADADPASTGVALDTENEENVALYEHKGFTITSRQFVDELPVYCMFRPGGDGRG